MIYGAALSATYLAATIAAAVAGRLTQHRSATWLMRVVLILVAAATHSDALRNDVVEPVAPVLGGRGWRGARHRRTRRRPQRPAHLARAGGQPDVERRHPGVRLTAGAIIQISPALLLGLNVALYLAMAAILLAADRGLLDPLAALVQDRKYCRCPRSVRFARACGRAAGLPPFELQRLARPARSAAIPGSHAYGGAPCRPLHD